MVPPVLFAITLGGVSTTQVFSLFSFLIIWLLFIASASLWVSVLFKDKKESTIISSFLIVTFFITLSLLSYSPIVRLIDILSFAQPDITTYPEIIFYLAATLFFLYSSIKNLHYGVLFPITFLDDYFEKMKINRFKGQIENYNGQKITIRTPRRLPIVAKDKYLVPPKSAFSTNFIFNLLIILAIVSTLPVGILFALIWVIYAPLIKTWERVLAVFSLEIENETFSSLMTLPMSNKELFEEKVKSACIFDSIKAVYPLVGIPMVAIGIVQFNLSIILMGVALPFLFYSLVYSTSLVVFKSKEMTKISSFSICLILMLIYFSIPYAAFLYYFLLKYLKKLNIKELDKIGEISD